MYLGLDLGGSGAKALAFSATGELLARAKASYAPSNPRPGAYEFDPNEQWGSLRAATRDCVARLSAHADVVAIGVSAAGEAVVPVDPHGRPLAASIASSDPRGQDEAEYLIERIGVERLYEITGQPPDGIYAICRVLWLRRHRPDVFDRVDKFLLWHEYVLSRLGVPVLLDSPNASRTMAFDLDSGTWSHVLTAAEVHSDRFAPVAKPGTAAGRVPDDVASDLGLRSRPLVVVAGFDQACAAVGAGMLEDGDGSIGSGSVEALAVSSHRRPAAPGLRLANFSTGPAVPRGRYLTVGSNFGAGNLMTWLFGVMGQRDALGAALDEARPSARPSGRVQVIPHLAGAFAPVRDSDRRAAIIGCDSATSTEELVWAALEGICYQLRTMVETVEASGLPLRRLRLSGGGARSDVWAQLRADVLGRAVETLVVSDAAALGAAMAAAVGAGAFSDWESATVSMVRVRQHFEPGPTERVRIKTAMRDSGASMP